MIFCCSYPGFDTNNLKEIGIWTNWQPCSEACYDIDNPPVRQRHQILTNNTGSSKNNTETQICEDVPLCNARFGKLSFLIESIHYVKTFLPITLVA